MPGKVVLVATPIGNPEDLSPRAARTLAEADIIAAEDTRVSAKLIQANRKPKLVTVNEHTTTARLEGILQHVQQGAALAIVTDAGTPAISDPGSEIVDLAYQRGIEVDSVPGPSAVSNALVLSGFFAQRYVFLGYLPRKQGPAIAELAPFADSTMTLVLFESPHRAGKTLEAISEALGERRVAVCREMTKRHQQVLRGPVSAVLAQNLPTKGEYCIVIEGKRKLKERL